MSEGSGTENAGRRVIPPPTQGISLIPSSKGRFRDVSISDILDERSYAVEGNVLRIYLKLAGPPPVGWAFMFNTVWESVSYPDKVPASAQDGLLWVECLPNDFATIHLPQLEQAVARTNETYRPSLQQKVSVERGQKQMAADARAQLKELRRLFQPQATSPTQNRTKSQCLVGIAMSAFCLLWCVVGLLPFTLVARWRAEHPTSYVMVWVAIAIAAGAAAIADFRRAMRHRAKKD